MTVHWIDQATLTRKKSVLACRRLKGRHTYDILAKEISDIHWDFQIEEKLIDLYFRSTQVADSIKDELGCLLVIPTITRWNSTFDAVNKLMQILRDREMRSGLNRICTSVRLPTFTNGM